jgi:hypothetical protein
MKFEIELVKRVEKNIVRDDKLEFGVATTVFDFGDTSIVFGKTIFDHAFKWMTQLKISFDHCFIQLCPDSIGIYLRTTDKIMFDGHHILLSRTNGRYTEEYFIDTCKFILIYDPHVTTTKIMEFIN